MPSAPAAFGSVGLHRGTVAPHCCNKAVVLVEYARTRGGSVRPSTVSEWVALSDIETASTKLAGVATGLHPGLSASVVYMDQPAKRKPWTDAAPLLIDVGTDGVRVVLPEWPALAWTVNCVRDDEGRPRVIDYRVSPADPRSVVLLDTLRTPPPLRQLAALWARTMSGESFDPFSLLEPVQLPRRPDARLRKRDPSEYQRRFHEWAEPIAEEVRRADSLGRHRQAAISEHFGVESSRADELIQLAREAGHDLPYLRPPKALAARRKNPTQPGRDDK